MSSARDFIAPAWLYNLDVSDLYVARALYNHLLHLVPKWSTTCCSLNGWEEMLSLSYTWHPTTKIHERQYVTSMNSFSAQCTTALSNNTWQRLHVRQRSEKDKSKESGHFSQFAILLAELVVILRGAKLVCWSLTGFRSCLATTRRRGYRHLAS